MLGRIVDAGAQAITWQAPVLFVQAAGTAVAAAAPDMPGAEMLLEVKDELAVLAFSGVAGAFTKAVMFPQSGWRKRAVYGLSSAISAVFLGGVVGAIAVKLGAPEVYAFLAAGFLTGFAGKEGITAMQEKVMGKPQ